MKVHYFYKVLWGVFLFFFLFPLLSSHFPLLDFVYLPFLVCFPPQEVSYAGSGIFF